MSSPSEKTIDRALRKAVQQANAAEEQVTINVIRERVESELDLEDGFLKSTEWKHKSRDIIKAAMNEAASQTPQSPSPSPPPKKRKSSAKQVPAEKRRKTTPPSESEEPKQEPETDANAAEESDYSIVHDSPPAPKPKRKSKTKSPPTDTNNKPTTTKKPSNTTTTTTDLSPDEQEIKRLQSQLVQCGMRKLWHRELAPYDTAKEKIKHLKGMLSDVGMSGRFSADKARQIKEARELEAELASAKEFEAQWGQKEGEGSSEEEEAAVGEEGKKPVKRLPKGLVDFGDSGDEGSD